MKVFPRLTLHNTALNPPAGGDCCKLFQQTRLVSSYAIPRILLSLAQTVSGGYQLYKAQGSQISQYGYAAYGLTVIPFVITSIINMLGSLLSSEYAAVYIVHSEIMDEMISRGGMVDVAVGTIAVPSEKLKMDRIKGERSCKVEGISILFEGSQNAPTLSTNKRLLDTRIHRFRPGTLKAHSENPL
jgi:hypothetical protein